MNKLWEQFTGKLKKSSSWFKEYLKEISVVVISIAITFYGDSLIEKYNNKQEDKEMMEMVRQELESNLAELSDMTEHYQLDNEFGTRLSAHLVRHESIPADSLDKYFNRHRTFAYWFLKKNAFDIMRVSGTVQRADKGLLMLLFESYEQLGVVSSIDEHYRDQRIALLLDFNASLPDGKHAETTTGQWKQIRQHEEFRQYLCNSMPLLSRTASRSCLKAKELIEDTLKKIDEKYP